MLKIIFLLVNFWSNALSFQPDFHSIPPSELIEMQWLQYAEHEPRYSGEEFPARYLRLEPPSTRQDLQLYLSALNRTVSHLLPLGNDTDLNVGFTGYLSAFTLKRALRDHAHKLSAPQLTLAKKVLHDIESLVSYFVASDKYEDYDIVWAVARMYRETSAETLMLQPPRRGMLAPSLRSAHRLHAFARAMDAATLDRMDYHRLMINITNHHINLNDSDLCLARIADQPEPSLVGPVRRCAADTRCEAGMAGAPSSAYSLSHRQLNLELRRLDRRCLITTQASVDALCAWMFREAVYIARRGFFARDMFVEHVAMCGVHEEVARPSWYRKIASMVDEDGCASETFSFKVNRSAARLEQVGPGEGGRAEWTRRLRKRLEERCDLHLMAVITWALAGAVRHALWWL